MQDPGTRILRGVELKDHPLWIWPDVIVQQPKSYGTDVVFELLGFPGSDNDAAHRWPTKHPCDRNLRRTGAMPCGHFLERIHDVVAHLSVEGHELARVREAASARRRIIAAVLAGQEPASQRTPDQNADVVVLGERLELVLEAPADEAVVHLCRHIFL